jgi:hypothetical protein
MPVVYLLVVTFVSQEQFQNVRAFVDLGLFTERVHKSTQYCQDTDVSKGVLAAVLSSSVRH